MPWVKKTVPATTNNITTAIINHLLSKGHSASRINVQGQYDEKRQLWRKSGSRNGYLDISACILGRGVAIDIKKGRDELGADQIEFINEWTQAGGFAFEIKSYDHWLRCYDWLIKIIYVESLAIEKARALSSSPPSE